MHGSEKSLAGNEEIGAYEYITRRVIGDEKSGDLTNVRTDQSHVLVSIHQVPAVKPIGGSPSIVDLHSIYNLPGNSLSMK